MGIVRFMLFVVLFLWAWSCFRAVEIGVRGNVIRNDEGAIYFMHIDDYRESWAVIQPVETEVVEVEFGKPRRRAWPVRAAHVGSTRMLIVTHWFAAVSLYAVLVVLRQRRAVQARRRGFDVGA